MTYHIKRLSFDGQSFWQNVIIDRTSDDKYKIKVNPIMCILMYFKIQSDKPRVTRNAFKMPNLRVFY